MFSSSFGIVKQTFSDLRVRDKFALINAMSVDPLYLQHKHAQKAVDYRVSRSHHEKRVFLIFYYFTQHWGVALSRRFRSLKLWFTIRSYGIDGLRYYIREVFHIVN